MATKIVKKRKIKVLNLVLVLLVLALFALTVAIILNTKTKNIIILGTKYLKDDELIEQAKVKNYPSFYLNSSSKIEKRLKKNPLVKKVEVKKKFFHVLEIKIEENRPLFYNETNQTVVLENLKEIKLEELSSLRIPRLMNYVPNEKYESLVGHIKKINIDILGKVSEITYLPNDYDKDRFMLYMDDDNTVYLTLTKFKMLNYYNKVLTQLDGRKGILYLDSGNHFQIRE